MQSGGRAGKAWSREGAFTCLIEVGPAISPRVTNLRSGKGGPVVSSWDGPAPISILSQAGEVTTLTATLLVSWLDWKRQFGPTDQASTGITSLPASYMLTLSRPFCCWSTSAYP